MGGPHLPDGSFIPNKFYNFPNTSFSEAGFNSNCFNKRGPGIEVVSIIADADRASWVDLYQKALSQNYCNRLFTEFVKIFANTDHSRRQAVWVTRPPCKCPYHYGKGYSDSNPWLP